MVNDEEIIDCLAKLLDIGVVCIRRERFLDSSKISLYVLQPYRDDLQVEHQNVPKGEAREYLKALILDLVEFAQQEQSTDD
jgi:hypothetical protein